MSDLLVKKEILGIGFTNASDEEILEYIVNSLENNTPPYYIVTPNPEMIVFAASHPDFKSTLNRARISLCDGIGLFMASKIFNNPIKERISGTDFVENLCEKSNNKLIRVGFLGAGANVAEKAAERLQKKYPNLHISFVGEEWNEDFSNKKSVLSSKYNVLSIKNKNEKHSIYNTKYIIQNTGIDILFVAFGFPKQEEWMKEHIGKIPVKVMVGVGGAFDYISGNVMRAPEWIRTLGLEWLFRLVNQPWRWRRQLALVRFIWMVFREKWDSIKGKV